VAQPPMAASGPGYPPPAAPAYARSSAGPTYPPPPARAVIPPEGVTPAYSPSVSTYPPPPPAAAYPAGPSTYTPAPQYIPPVEPIVPEEDPRSARTRRREARRERRAGKRPGCLKITWSILKWEILWAAAGWLAYDALGQRYPWIVIPVGLVALLFMLLYLRRFRHTAIEGAA